MKKKPDAATPDHYAVVIISDLHIGMKFGAGDMLCEFLHNVKCDRLILNGDIIDGRLLNHRRPKDLPERQKRVLDAINRKIAEGTEVIYIPGNHDITLRRMDVAGKTFMGVKIEQSMDFTDPKGRKFLILHGDQFDQREKRAEELPDWLLGSLERANEALTTISAAVDKVTQATLRARFNLAGRVRGLLENNKRRHRDLERQALKHAQEKGYDGVICGHTHKAACKTKDGLSYMNSGDWVDGFTALTMDKAGDWSVVPWRDRRKERGLKRKFFRAANDNPDKEFRPQTEKMVAVIRTIWPGKTRKKSPRPKPPQP
ncbi:MAG: UDP-2,3-diacylglucosamine diphosphatase [Alphaproteobacteria bacterium]